MSYNHRHNKGGKGKGKGKGNPYGQTASPYGQTASPYGQTSSPYGQTGGYAQQNQGGYGSSSYEQQSLQYSQQQPQAYYDNNNNNNYYEQSQPEYDNYNGGYGGGNYELSNAENEEEAQLDEIFAAMDAMGVQSDNVPDYDEALQDLESRDVITASPPSPTMNVGAMEFVPGKGFAPKVTSAPPTQTSLPTPPAPAPAPAAATSVSGPSSSVSGTTNASPSFVLTANAVNHKVDKAALEKQETLKTNVQQVINDGAYSLKQQGKFDLSFKGRKNVVFPHLETLVKEKFPDVTFKSELKMDLRNFIAETLRSWEKDPDWYTPPVV